MFFGLIRIPVRIRNTNARLYYIISVYPGYIRIRIYKYVRQPYAHIEKKVMQSSDEAGFGVMDGPLPYSVISSVLMVVNPSEKLFKEVENYFGRWIEIGKTGHRRQLFDMDIINRKFACHGKIVVLPKFYGTLNSEFLQSERLSQKFDQCKDVKKVYYMHFSGLGIIIWTLSNMSKNTILRYSQESNDG